ncbi:MAG TPA: serine/threonine-protein kinase [Nannocystaceae bacterium]|nr:serine/threonine-protein kinase [Nannocystaceae bacterium]
MSAADPERALQTSLPSQADDVTPAPELAALALRSGDRIGRYRIDGELGVGGQGVVLLATDPELDRKVAIKLLWARGREARALLLREGRALARLEHPNVVRVFDVGEIDSGIFLAMEFVDGGHLATYWTEHRLDRHAKIATLVAAGRGLAAAHAAGLVHRDFKPKNVLVAKTGRVAVTDFGLVRESVPATSTEQSLSDPRAMLGTPAYMAPEQFLSPRVDHRADQFAFCVALYEAVYGGRPFPGRNVQELFSAMMLRAMRPPEGAPRAPRWLQQILARGLEIEPAKRFASMDELLAALDRPRPRRAARVLAAVGCAALVGVGAFALRERPVSSAAALVLAPALAEVERPNTEWTMWRVEATMAAIDEQLLAGDVEGARTAAEQVRVEAEAAGDGVLMGAAMNTRADCESALGDLASSRATLEALAADARTRGDDWRLSLAALDLADLAFGERRLAQSLSWTREAEVAAQRAGMPEGFVVALELRRAAVAYELGELDEALAGFYTALDLVDVEEVGEETQATLHNAIGAVEGAQYEWMLAIAELEAALAIYADVYPPDSPALADPETNLGLILIKAGEHEKGLAYVRGAHARVRAAHVGVHPDLAYAELAVASAFGTAGDVRECTAHAQEADRLGARAMTDVVHRVQAKQIESGCRLRAGDAEGAEAAAAHAMALVDDAEVDPNLAAGARAMYAEAAWAAGHRAPAMRAAARALVEATDPVLAGEVAQWLTAPRGARAPERLPPR